MNKTSKLLILIFICVFTTLCYNVVSKNPMGFDKTVQNFAFGLRDYGFSKILIPVTYMANPETITGACILLLILPKTRKNFGIPLAISCLISLLTYKVIKHLVLRPRPDVALHLVNQGGYSFPSGHSITSVIFYGVLAIILGQMIYSPTKKKVFYALICILVFLIGFSRIYVGVHWPSDVIAGFSLGLSYIIFFRYFYFKKLKSSDFSNHRSIK